MPAHLALINPKSPQNVGSILRAAGCYNAQSVRYTGERYARAKAFTTDTKNTHQNIDVQQVKQLIDPVTDNFRSKIAIELVEGATPLPLFDHPEDALYIFGPEDGSIDQNTIDLCDHVIYIPTNGCMNLAATVNVVLYDRLAKMSNMPMGDDIIKNSRDTNNRTKVY